MPLYDYECHGCGLRYEATLPIAQRVTSCPDCIEPCAPLITFRGALQGLSSPGSAATAWDHGGMWGAVGSHESAALDDTRSMLESGAYRTADNRTRQSALVFSRVYEMARKNGQDAEARSIEGRMARLTDVRKAELAGAPRIEKRGEFTRTEGPTVRRRVRKMVEGKPAMVTEVTRTVRYS